jgi:hydroxymethylglutaryl-CoA reductase (NADPH)
MRDSISVPQQTIGPIKIVGKEVDDLVSVPMATFEKPLWSSTHRVAKLSQITAGIHTVVVSECMTRSVVVEAQSANQAVEVRDELNNAHTDIQAIISTTSRFAKLKDIHFEIIGKLLYIRLSIDSADASGQNMVTHAASEFVNWLLKKYNFLNYVSVSGNFCVDKKVSAINGILGRGRNIIAEIRIPRELCLQSLKTTPEKIVALNYKKNWIGSNIAGGVRTANAHFANMLLACYLACGQDAANIVEGSQGFVYAQVDNDELYFSVNCPNLIVGTIGSGKSFAFIKENFQLMGLLEKKSPGANARRFACIIAATVLCGELSLLAAQTIPGELMRAHLIIERKHKN